ncbi:hypothetical protein P3574_24505, partial [Vibrio parahaemolyticus]|nr:hypothetical protein [Vibrio parahaemolyticus]
MSVQPVDTFLGRCTSGYVVGYGVGSKSTGSLRRNLHVDSTQNYKLRVTLSLAQTRFPQWKRS